MFVCLSVFKCLFVCLHVPWYVYVCVGGEEGRGASGGHVGENVQARSNYFLLVYVCIFTCMRVYACM